MKNIKDAIIRELVLTISNLTDDKELLNIVEGYGNKATNKQTFFQIVAWNSKLLKKKIKENYESPDKKSENS